MTPLDNSFAMWENVEYLKVSINWFFYFGVVQLIKDKGSKQTSIKQQTRSAELKTQEESQGLWIENLPAATKYTNISHTLYKSKKEPAPLKEQAPKNQPTAP